VQRVRLECLLLSFVRKACGFRRRRRVRVIRPRVLAQFRAGVIAMFPPWVIQA
jgi:hypothetical protein